MNDYIHYSLLTGVCIIQIPQRKFVDGQLRCCCTPIFFAADRLVRMRNNKTCVLILRISSSVARNIELVQTSEGVSDSQQSMAAQGDGEAEDLLAEWSRDLEAVLYEPEVEEAIREVCALSRVATLTHHSPPSSLPPHLSQQVCPTSDPLDSKDFDPIDYINQLFPTEQVRPLTPIIHHTVFLSTL